MHAQKVLFTIAWRHCMTDQSLLPLLSQGSTYEILVVRISVILKTEKENYLAKGNPFTQ